MDMQTEEEVFDFVANNTFIDGETLYQAFPEVKEFLT